MTDLVDYVAVLIRLAGGQIVGKTRLQKIAYLLEAKALGFGLEFDYHNFGPFSPDLAFAADDAESLGYIHTEEQYGLHSVPYKIFRSTRKTPSVNRDKLSKDRRDALNIMKKHSAIVLELAATAIYLKNNGYSNDSWREVKKRKGLKATQSRISAAKILVNDLGL